MDLKEQPHELTIEEQREYCRDCMDWITPDDDDISSEPEPFCTHFGNQYNSYENAVREGRV